MASFFDPVPNRFKSLEVMPIWLYPKLMPQEGESHASLNMAISELSPATLLWLMFQVCGSRGMSRYPKIFRYPATVTSPLTMMSSDDRSSWLAPSKYPPVRTAVVSLIIPENLFWLLYAAAISRFMLALGIFIENRPSTMYFLNNEVTGALITLSWISVA